MMETVEMNKEFIQKKQIEGEDPFQMVETKEGREKLCDIIVRNVRQINDNVNLARKILVVDKDGAKNCKNALYLKEIGNRTTAYYVSSTEELPKEKIRELRLEGFIRHFSRCKEEEVKVPLLENNFVKSLSFNYIAKFEWEAINKVIDNIVKNIIYSEEIQTFRCIDTAIRKSRSMNLCGDRLSGEYFRRAFSMIEDEEMHVAKVIMSPEAYGHLRLCKDREDFFEKATRRDILLHGLYGHIWDSDVHVSPRVAKGSIYFLPAAEFLGGMPFSKDFYIESKKGFREEANSIDFSVTEQVGYCIINDLAISEIKIR